MSEDLETYTMTLQEERDYYCECMRELQQENKQLKDKIEKLKDYGEKVGERRNELYDKIDKAIEYIEEKGRLKYKPEELLEILEDKENNTITLNTNDMNITGSK